MQPTDSLARIVADVNAAVTAKPRRAIRKRTAKEVCLVTINQIEKILMTINGAKAVTLLARTQVKMRKTGNPYHDQVFKLQEHNVFVNFNYAKAVNRQREREGNTFPFLAHPRKWGVRLPYTCMVLHNNQYYMEAKVQRSGDKQYTFRGRPIDHDTFRGFVIQPSQPKTQAVVYPVIVRDFNTLSIVEITIDSVRYRIKESSRRTRARDNARYETANRAAVAAQALQAVTDLVQN